MGYKETNKLPIYESIEASYLKNQTMTNQLLFTKREKLQRSLGKRIYIHQKRTLQNLHTGSSKMTNFGSPIRAIATLSRRFIPPL